jgi:hypothetical protein
VSVNWRNFQHIDTKSSLDVIFEWNFRTGTDLMVRCNAESTWKITQTRTFWSKEETSKNKQQTSVQQQASNTFYISSTKLAQQLLMTQTQKNLKTEIRLMSLTYNWEDPSTTYLSLMQSQ